MQGKDPFLALLGVFILSTTFFFCGKGSVTSPPPVASENLGKSQPPAAKLIEPSPSPPSLVATPAVVKKKIDDLLIGNTTAFRINSAILLPEGKTVLNSVAEILHKDPTMAFEIGGLRGHVGPEQEHRVLSEQRAKAVVEYLTAQGIAAERLTPKGDGAPRPIAESAPDGGRGQSRKVDLSIGTTEEQP